MWDNFLSFFIWQPGHIFAISAVFAVLFLVAQRAKSRLPQVSSLPLFAISLAWLAYGFWEREAAIQKWDIRVDLLIGWPLLFGGTAIALVHAAQSVKRALATVPATDPGLSDSRSGTS